MFCNFLKKGGIFVVGGVVQGTVREAAPKRERMFVHWINFIKEKKLKAFASIVIAPSCRVGYNSLVLSAGLGALNPNIVVVPFATLSDEESELSDSKSDLADLDLMQLQGSSDFVGLIADITQVKRNVVVAANFTNQLDTTYLFKTSVAQTVDIWLPEELTINCMADLEGTPLLMLALAHVLKRKGSSMSLKLFRVVGRHHPRSVDEELELITELVKRQARFRIGKHGSQIKVLCSSDALPLDKGASVTSPEEQAALSRRRLNQLMSQHSSEGALVVLPLPALPAEFTGDESISEREFESVSQQYVLRIKELVQGVKPCLLVHFAGYQKIMSLSL